MPSEQTWTWLAKPWDAWLRGDVNVMFAYTGPCEMNVPEYPL
jgi:hypothetical protein